MSAKGTLYIIPLPISEEKLDRVIPTFNAEVVNQIRFFVVEKIKTSRQFLRKMNSVFPIDDCVFFEQDKHDDYTFHLDAIQQLKKGNDVGLMSEAGYPAVADPGSKLVALAHDAGCKVVPLVGPSSLLLSIAASGMNGQGFTFHGYLPKVGNDLSQKLKEIYNQVQRNGFTQLFIETPYRNKQIFDEVLKTAPAEIKLTIASDITGTGEKIITKKISDWKKSPFEFEKLPCVFLIGL